ncbi:MAG: sigma-54 dependent transcriptional regulator [Magnetospirillum sp. WYHS-4]
MTHRPIVLVIDDEVRSLEAIRRVLADEFEVLTARDGAAAIGYLENELVQAVLCDQRMPDITGVEFLTAVRERWPDAVRMIISGHTDSLDIIAGLNEAGIYRYITKPWEPDALLGAVRDAVGLYALQQENQAVSVEMKMAAPALRQVVARKRHALKRRFGFDAIVHAPDSPLAGICDLVERIAPYDISILLTGESGTGKELLARAVHYNSARAARAFVVQNCGALPDELLESELFGCKKGAFTGAYEDRIGLFEQADGGTIFLDEIGDTSASFQVKLLRVLQEGEFRPLGAQRTRRVDVRVIAATNRDLEEAVRQGRFRQDLYYRLAAFPIHLPALRDRAMDLPLIATHLLAETGRSFRKAIQGFAPETLAAFARYSWPGNVRELSNEIQRMVALCDCDRLGPDLVSPAVLGAKRTAAPQLPVEIPAGTLKDRVEALEEGLLRDALSRHGWNISRAAAELGLSRVGLRAKLQRYGLERMN